MKLLRGVRRRRYPLGLAGRAHLVSGAVIITTVLASALIAATMFWALPTGAALNERHVLLLNVVTASIYSAISIPSAIVWGYLWLPSPPVPTRHRRAHNHYAPSRMAVIHGTVWLTATLVMVVINVKTPPLATTVGVSLLVAATVTTAMSYWMCERALRPSVAELLTKNPPTTPRGPGLRLRAVSAWVVGTGVPILFLMLIAASALVVDYPGDRLAWVVLTFGTGAIASGLTVAAFTAAATADPIDEVRRGMQHVSAATTRCPFRYSTPPSSGCCKQASTPWLSDFANASNSATSSLVTSERTWRGWHCKKPQ